MKILAWLLLLVFSTLPLQAIERPGLTLQQAIALADRSLASRGLQDKIWIVSINQAHLSEALLGKGQTYWYVKWSEAIPASNPKKQEIGLKITFDGTVERFVE